MAGCERFENIDIEGERDSAPRTAPKASNNHGIKRKAAAVDDEYDNSAKKKLDLGFSKAALSREYLQRKRHAGICTKLEYTLRGSKGTLSPAELQFCIQMVQVLDEKHKTVGKPTPKRKGPHPQTRAELLPRLLGEEEKRRPWAVPTSGPELAAILEKTPDMLIRVFDQSSKCQIKDPRIGFLSGGSDNLINTFERRRTALVEHSNLGNKHVTPFISFSSDPHEILTGMIPKLQARQAGIFIEDNTKLTIINTRVRIAAGMSIMCIKDELAAYAPSYTRKHWYGAEWLCTFNVSPKEIVRTWAWHKIELWMAEHKTDFAGWIRRVGRLAFEEHERARLSGKPVKCKKGCDCCGH